MQYAKIKTLETNIITFLNLDLEVERSKLLKMYFEEEQFYLEFYDTENNYLQEVISNSIRDLVFLLLYQKSPYLGHTFEHLSSRALDAILTNNSTEYEEIKKDRYKFYLNEVLE